MLCFMEHGLAAHQAGPWLSAVNAGCSDCQLLWRRLALVGLRIRPGLVIHDNKQAACT